MSLVPGLVYALFVASAVKSATPEQRVALKAALVSPMERYKQTGDPRLTVETIYNVLGEDWVPPEDYKEMINGLIAGMEES